MSEILKSVMAMILVIIIVASGAGITAANNESIAAADYLEEIAKVITESNYSEAVIDECIQEAEQNGYILQIELIGSKEPGMKRYAQVTLEYGYELKFLGVSDRKIKKIIV